MSTATGPVTERSDLRITRPIPIDDTDVTAPVRLDLYLSGDGS